MDKLVFLKLGGSLITDKARPQTARPDTLRRLADEIASVWRADPHLPLLLGHGSGSFGHVAAKKYATRAGFSSSNAHYWHGFNEVWHAANTLNKIVMSALRTAKLPVMAIPPSAGVIAHEGKVLKWNLEPIKRALACGIIPIVYGDVVFDEILGGTILSTEELFVFLARELRPKRILLAGLEDGIYADFPSRKQRVARVSPESYEAIRARTGASAATDVTGGMDSKVRNMVRLVKMDAALEAVIFSGEKAGNVKRVLLGENLGTLIAEN